MQENEDIKDVTEETEITEDDGAGNTTGAGTAYDSGVTRGKGNPISNHGNWESGVTRGKGNPLTVSEQVQKMKDLIAKL